MNNMPTQNVGGLLLDDDIAEDFTKFKEFLRHRLDSVMTDLCKVKHSFNIRLAALLLEFRVEHWSHMLTEISRSWTACLSSLLL